MFAGSWRIIRSLFLQEIFYFSFGNLLLEFSLNILGVELLIDNEIFFLGVVTIFLTLVWPKKIKSVFTSWNYCIFLIILAGLINLCVVLRLTSGRALLHLRLQVQWHIATVVTTGEPTQSWVLHLLFIIVELHKSVVLTIDISNWPLRVQQPLTLRMMKNSAISIHIIDK